MGYLVVAVILLLIAVGLVIGGLLAQFDRRNYFLGAVGAVAAFAVFTLICSVQPIGARSIGVETAFGSYHSSLNHGWHFIQPWASVEQFSTRLQPLNLDGSTSKTAGDSQKAVDVSYGGSSGPNSGNGGGSVEATIQWRATDDQIGKLWSDYQQFDHVRDRVVAPKARTAINDIVSTYTPVEARDGTNRVEMQNKATVELQTLLTPYGIEVDSVTITQVNLNATAQRAYDTVVSANANIAKVQADQKSAEIQAQTSKLQQTSLTPQALAKICLDITKGWNAKEQGALPATWNCGAGSSNLALTVPVK